jgi:hypothetical protein
LDIAAARPLPKLLFDPQSAATHRGLMKKDATYERISGSLGSLLLLCAAIERQPDQMQ